MQPQTKICQNCKNQFVIEQEDFVFYEKIKVPSPTFCPECRMVRRMVWRNERALYKRKCDAPGHNEEIISIYHKESLVKVYDQKYWWSDNWDPMDYGRDYDWNKSFFEQFKKLIKEVPQLNLLNKNDVNSFYCNWTVNIKDSYLSFRLHDAENCMYSVGTPYTKDSIDCLITRNSELCYWTSNCLNCYKLFFSRNCESCVNSVLLYDCKNCSNCFGCVGLRNKQYYIFNQSYSKDEYFKKLQELKSDDYNSLIECHKEFNNLEIQYPHKFANVIKSVNVIGDNVSNAKNCFYCFDSAKDIENCKFMLYAVDGVKDSYDGMFTGLNSELNYEVMSCQGTKCLSTIFTLNVLSLSYTINCHGCSNLFACIGLRNKQYCILNKQYSKEEYEELVPKIIKHMNDMPYTDKKGIVYKYGEFFPQELSPFAYNETIAQEYFPLTKEQAIEKGYNWKEMEQRNYQIDIKSENIPDHIKDVDDNIVNKVIECQHQGKCNEQCTTAFKIIKPELKFYRKMNLPLPRLCPNCRHYQRIKQRNPLKLWHRQCQCAGVQSDNKIYQNTIKHFHEENHCPNEFETTYSPDRKEIVYCEKCYQQEVV